MFWTSRCRSESGGGESRSRLHRLLAGPWHWRPRPPRRARTAPALRTARRPQAPPPGCGPGASSLATTGPAAARDWLPMAPPWRSGTPLPCFLKASNGIHTLTCPFTLLILSGRTQLFLYTTRSFFKHRAQHRSHRCWLRWAPWRFRHASSMFYLDPAGTPCHPVILSSCHGARAPRTSSKSRTETAYDRTPLLCHGAPRPRKSSKIVPKRPTTERHRSVMAPRTPENRAKSHRNPLPGRP